MNFYRSIVSQTTTEPIYIYDESYRVKVNNSVFGAPSAYRRFLRNNTVNVEIYIGNNVKNCADMFMFANNFNSNVHMHDNMNCTSMFEECGGINTDLYIADGIYSCTEMFTNCTKLNANIHLPNNCNNFYRFFSNCYNYNCPMILPNNVSKGYLYLAAMLYGCNRFNQDVVIPKDAFVQSMFGCCTNMSGNIYFNVAPSNYRNLTYLIGGRHNTHEINIFCNDLTNFLTTNSSSIVGLAVTWTTVENGYYNALYNVYLYNNYVPK